MKIGEFLFLRVLAGAALLQNACAKVPPPGEVLDLSPFDALQTPLDDGHGGMTQIKHPELDTYSSEYMYTDEWDTSKVVIWAPINGVVSGNGAGPRTELTEENSLFTFSGKHTMKFTQQVKQINSCSDVCIGQIKGDDFDEAFEVPPTWNTTQPHYWISEGRYESLHRDHPIIGASCLIVVELTYDGSHVTAHTRNEHCDNVSNDLGHFDLDEEIIIEMTVDDYDVFISSNKVTLPKIDYSFWKGAHYGMHFKVGVYDQCTGNSDTDGSKSKLSNLKITHYT